MMKWFLAALVAANVVVALLGALSKPAPTDIKSRESNANQIKLAGQGNEPSPLEALTAPKPGSALAAAQQEAAKNPPPAAAPAAPAAPATPPVTTLAAALAPEPAKAPEHKPAAPKPEPLKEASKPMPAPVSKPEPKPAEVKKPEAKPEPKAEAKPAEVKKPEPKVELKDSKPAEKKPEPAKPEVAKTDAKAADKKADAKPDAKPKLVCYQATDLDSAAASKLKAALNKAGLAAKMHETVQEAGRTGGKFWVYLPSYPNRDEAVKQSAALKDKGFDNYIVNTEGENKNGLSMGLFSQEDSAKAMVKRLNDSGYPAKLTPRGGTAVTNASVRLDGLDEAGSAALSKAGVSMKPVSCKP
ncbi:SPOR domain-containing protein [Rivihabitans pingtungensis]|uniref:SPOR domain-containing protein n=1 Tax=Rivihabitans pingtungensis TaxID=1054498 RepID=UPI002FD87EFA